MATLKFILVILEVLLLFNLLIGVHELGHFLAAKWRGLKIDRFAIWFGKPIWKKNIAGVEYALGWIPAGGYVALPQMATMEAIEGKGDSDKATLPQISPLDKIIVAFAGPLFSFLLAIVFAFIVWTVGKPVNDAENSTTIGWVAQIDDEGNPAPAWKAGLRPGDRILAVDDHPVSRFSPFSKVGRGRELQESITWRIITSTGTNITVKYIRDGATNTASIEPYHRPTKWYERKALRQILILSESPAVIYKVASNSPAALVGLAHGDEIVAMDGAKIFNPETVILAEEMMSNTPVRPINVTVRRGSEQFDRTLIAEKPVQPTNSHPSLGILAFQAETNVAIIHPTPLDQIADSADQIVTTLGAVLSRHGEIGFQQLGGAVMIIRLYSNLFTSDYGWRLVLWFSVVLNVNLALLNLLPFPVLDGGHIVLALIEAVRRRPVSARLLQYIQTACAMVLIGFMLFIAFYDAGDWIRSARNSHEEPIVFAPKN